MLCRAQEEKRIFYSFEYFPPKTQVNCFARDRCQALITCSCQEGVANLYARLDRMAALEPAFMDVTWGAGGSTADLTLDISITAQNQWVRCAALSCACLLAF